MSLLLLLQSAAGAPSTRTLVVGGYPVAAGGLVVGLQGLFGYRGSSIPATGDDGTSPLANDGIGASDEYLWQITALPATGTVDADDLGAFLHTSPVGSNTTTYSVFIVRAATGAYEVLSGQTISTSGAGATQALASLSAVVQAARAALSGAGVVVSSRPTLAASAAAAVQAARQASAAGDVAVRALKSTSASLGSMVRSQGVVQAQVSANIRSGGALQAQVSPAVLGGQAAQAALAASISSPGSAIPVSSSVDVSVRAGRAATSAASLASVASVLRTTAMSIVAARGGAIATQAQLAMAARQTAGTQAGALVRGARSAGVPMQVSIQAEGVPTLPYGAARLQPQVQGAGVSRSNTQPPWVRRGG